MLIQYLTKQQVIESGNMNVTVETLADIVRSTGHQLELRVV